MSQTRHLFLFDPKGRHLADVAGGSWDFKHGHVLKRHSHPEDQLLFAAEGVMAVDTDQGIWVVPPVFLNYEGAFLPSDISSTYFLIN
jgi:hypothetical protein